MTQRIEFFNMSQRFQPFFQIRKELHPFSFNTTQRIEPFSLNMTQRNEHLFLSCDSKNWNIWSRNMTQRIEPCVKKKKTDSKNVTLFKGLIELNLFLWTSSQYDSKSWSLFFKMTRRIEPFLFSNMTQRIDFFKMLKELNLSSIWITFLHDSNWTLFLINTTQRVEFFTKNDSKCWTPFWIWLKELNLFCIGLKELNFFFQPFDSKNWAFFYMSPKLKNFF